MPEVSYIIFKFWISHCGGTSFTTVSKFNMLIYLYEYFQKFRFWPKMESINWANNQCVLSLPSLFHRYQGSTDLSSLLHHLQWSPESLEKMHTLPICFSDCPLRIHSALSKVKLISIIPPVDEEKSHKWSYVFQGSSRNNDSLQIDTGKVSLGLLPLLSRIYRGQKFWDYEWSERWSLRRN